MKKGTIMILAIALFVSIAGTASAETQLNATVDELLGTKYLWGGTTTKGFDCSGFTMYVFAQFDIDLPHQSKGQAKKGEAVNKKDLRPGDLVFFDTGGSGISHVGIYLGDDEFAHSASNKGVVINKLSEDYYKKRYITARRVLDEDVYNKIAVESNEEEQEQ